MPHYPKPLFIDLKGEVDINTITVGDFSTSLKPIGRMSRQQVIRKH